MSLTFPKLYRFQYDVLQDQSRFKIIAAGRQIGKSFLCRTACSLSLLRGEYCIWLAPDNRQLNSQMNELYKFLKPITISFNKTTKILTTNTGGTIEFISCEKKTITRGRACNLLVMDECAWIPNLLEIWESEVLPTFSTTKGRAFLISTPKGKNDFYKMFCWGDKNHPTYNPDFKSFHATQDANPMIDKETRKKNMSRLDAVGKQEYLATFEDVGACPFMMDKLKECTREELSESEPVCYGIDVGLQVDNSYICGLDKDAQLCRFHGPQKGTAGEIKKWIIENVGKIPTLIDSTGAGLPIQQDLAETHGNIQGFVFTHVSRQLLLQQLADAINENLITINIELKLELEKFGIEQASNGQLKYRQGGDVHNKTDDCVMALALAYQQWKLDQNYGGVITFTAKELGLTAMKNNSNNRFRHKLS